MTAIIKHIGVLVIVGISCLNFYWSNVKTNDKRAVNLVIGILSARENYHQRQVIRETWLSHSSEVSALDGKEGQSYEAWFIVGNTSCMVPPPCRQRHYSCREWIVNVTEVRSSFYLVHSSPIRKAKSEPVTLYKGFSFQVNHPVILTELGVSKNVFAHDKKAVVFLLDLQTKEILVKATIHIDDVGRSSSEYIFKDVETFLLPKGYEGLLLVDSHLTPCDKCSHAMWNNNSGIITINRVYRSKEDLDSIPFTSDLSVAPSIRLLVHNLTELNATMRKCQVLASEWKLYQEKISSSIMEESIKFQDMVITDVLDTYRNLPKKLLHFYTWLSSNVDCNFVLKADDDCIINLERVLEKLSSSEIFNTEGFWVWSRFRSHWTLDRVGKWAEYAYKSSVYPSFPCGGGYVLSQPVVKWLQHNAEYLHPYQGEDVSLGIWLTAINPYYINDVNWNCGSKCSNGSYNRAQLTVDELQNSWSMKKRCGNICSCEL